MKELRKENQKFICEECDQIFSSRQGIGNHICRIHGAKQYYDKWLMEENEGSCHICHNEAKFRSLNHGYNYVCNNIKCLNKFKHQNLEKGMINKYGTHAAVYVKEIKDKQETTCIRKYGEKNPLSSNKIQAQIKQTNIKKYGCENPMENKKIKIKAKNTNFKKYGYYNASQSPEVQNKIQKTMFKKYGVKSFLECQDKMKTAMFKKYGVNYALQNNDIFIKNQKARFVIKKYKDTNIYYRGSFELDFLEKYYDKYPDIQNGIAIKYEFQHKQKIYFPDFYIPSLNLIVECKNSYLYKKDLLKITTKEKATIANGFNYCLIIDKDYKLFNNQILLL